MSWSVSASGKAEDVAKSVSDTIARSKCSEPEETIKNKVGEALAVALKAMPEDVTVELSAYGSQTDLKGDKARNNLVVNLSYK